MRKILLSMVMLACCLIPAGAQAAWPAPVEARHGMVVTAQHLASRIGVDILKAGGNAVDAAVAVGYALAVVHPCCGNLGGGGFATIHLADGGNHFVNFRETAPGRATADMYLDENGDPVSQRSRRGYLAVGVPGTVLGLDTMLERFGTMSRSAVMQPATELARDGYVLQRGDTDVLRKSTDAFRAESNVAAIFLDDGEPYEPGERLVQSALADTLDAIVENGPAAFYDGAVAEAIVEASDRNGGLLTRKDFREYAVSVSEPLTCTYRGYTILSSPPPSSGGTTICEILGVLEAFPMGDLGFHSAKGVHLMVEAMRHAYVDRNYRLGDPAFVDNPVDHLLSDAHLSAIRDRIDPTEATPSGDVQPGKPPHESTDTTHFSIVDEAGNAVSLTYTINGLFGAKVIAGDTGFFLNNEMDDFTAKPGSANMFGLVQGEANAIAPGKRPLSSMSPTIVTRNGDVAMVIGSPGGSRIITITLEAIMNVIDYGMDVQAAIDAPRIHHQWLPDTVQAEPFALSPDTRRLLEAMGHAIEDRAPWGAAEGIRVRSGPSGAETGDPRLSGANDDRRPAGAARGY